MRGSTQGGEGITGTPRSSEREPRVLGTHSSSGNATIAQIRSPEFGRKMGLLLRSRSLREHNIDVAKGLGENGTRMLRVGHFGNLTGDQADYFADSFAKASSGR